MLSLKGMSAKRHTVTHSTMAHLLIVLESLIGTNTSNIDINPPARSVQVSSSSKYHQVL